MIGGDFAGLLEKWGVLCEETTRWYIGQMILGVEEVHMYGWIHRDVKPANFLISGSGHLKIADFGFAFDGSRNHDPSFFARYRNYLLGRGPKPTSQNFPRKRKMAKSLVGTTMYMAPEVLVGSFYDGRCDYWSLGVIFYEV
jgi:hypothetical protein